MKRPGLRTRLLLAFVVASLATLAATWLVVLPTLEHRFERERLDELSELVRTVRPELAAVPVHARRPGSPALIRIVERLERRTGGRIVVYDSAGRELAGNGTPSPPEDFTVAAVKANGVVMSRRGPVATAATITSRPQRLTLVIAKRLDDSRAAASVLRAGLPLALGVGIGVALVLAFLLSRGLLHGLGRLRADAEALATDGLAHKVTVAGADEIAVVAQALEDMRERLVVEQQARADFLSTASHELRTPLASLQASLELLQDELSRGVTETADRRTEAALRQTRRLIALASDLLDLSRVEGGAVIEPEPLELEELVETVAREFAPRLDLSGRALKVDGRPALARADPAAVARIVRILLDNAANYGDGEVTIDVTPEHGHVLVAVADAGAGIPDDERERMFQRFVRGAAANGSAGGAGLGLPIARGLARAMGGDLAVSGSRFQLIVPAA